MLQVGVTAEDVRDKQSKVNGQASGLPDRRGMEETKYDNSEVAGGAVFRGVVASFARTENATPVERTVPGTIALASMIVDDLDITEGGYPVVHRERNSEAGDSNN